MIEGYPIPQPEKDTAVKRRQATIEICEHRFALRRMVCSNGTVQYREQCPKCGKGLPAISARSLAKGDKERAPLFDRGLEHRVRRDAWERQTTTVEEEWQAKWWSWYNGYLASHVWGRKRAAVLKRRGEMCEACGKERAVIAHHLTYRHVGAEPLYDLVAVCSSCHDQIHNQQEGTK